MIVWVRTISTLRQDDAKSSSTPDRAAMGTDSTALNNVIQNVEVCLWGYSSVLDP